MSGHLVLALLGGFLIGLATATVVALETVRRRFEHARQKARRDDQKTQLERVPTDLDDWRSGRKR